MLSSNMIWLFIFFLWPGFESSAQETYTPTEPTSHTITPSSKDLKNPILVNASSLNGHLELTTLEIISTTIRTETNIDENGKNDTEADDTELYEENTTKVNRRYQSAALLSDEDSFRDSEEAAKKPSTDVSDSIDDRETSGDVVIDIEHGVEIVGSNNADYVANTRGMFGTGDDFKGFSSMEMNDQENVFSEPGEHDESLFELSDPTEENFFTVDAQDEMTTEMPKDQYNSALELSYYGLKSVKNENKQEIDANFDTSTESIEVVGGDDSTNTESGMENVSGDSIQDDLEDTEAKNINTNEKDEQPVINNFKIISDESEGDEDIPKFSIQGRFKENVYEEIDVSEHGNKQNINTDLSTDDDTNEETAESDNITQDSTQELSKDNVGSTEEINSSINHGAIQDYSKANEENVETSTEVHTEDIETVSDESEDEDIAKFSIQSRFKENKDEIVDNIEENNPSDDGVHGAEQNIDHKVDISNSNEETEEGDDIKEDPTQDNDENSEEIDSSDSGASEGERNGGNIIVNIDNSEGSTEVVEDTVETSTESLKVDEEDIKRVSDESEGDEDISKFSTQGYLEKIDKITDNVDDIEEKSSSNDDLSEEIDVGEHGNEQNLNLYKYTDDEVTISKAKEGDVITDESTQERSKENGDNVSNTEEISSSDNGVNEGEGEVVSEFSTRGYLQKNGHNIIVDADNSEGISASDNASTEVEENVETSTESLEVHTEDIKTMSDESEGDDIPKFPIQTRFKENTNKIVDNVGNTEETSSSDDGLSEEIDVVEHGIEQNLNAISNINEETEESDYVKEESTQERSKENGENVDSNKGVSDEGEGETVSESSTRGYSQENGENIIVVTDYSEEISSSDNDGSAEVVEDNVETSTESLEIDTKDIKKVNDEINRSTDDEVTISNIKTVDEETEENQDVTEDSTQVNSKEDSDNVDGSEEFNSSDSGGNDEGEGETVLEFSNQDNLKENEDNIINNGEIKENVEMSTDSIETESITVETEDTKTISEEGEDVKENAYKSQSSDENTEQNSTSDESNNEEMNLYNESNNEEIITEDTIVNTKNFEGNKSGLNNPSNEINESINTFEETIEDNVSRNIGDPRSQVIDTPTEVSIDEDTDNDKSLDSRDEELRSNIEESIKSASTDDTIENIDDDVVASTEANEEETASLLLDTSLDSKPTEDTEYEDPTRVDIEDQDQGHEASEGDSGVKSEINGEDMDEIVDEELGENIEEDKGYNKANTEVNVNEEEIDITTSRNLGFGTEQPISVLNLISEDRKEDALIQQDEDIKGETLTFTNNNFEDFDSLTPEDFANEDVSGNYTTDDQKIPLQIKFESIEISKELVEDFDDISPEELSEENISTTEKVDSKMSKFTEEVPPVVISDSGSVAESSESVEVDEFPNPATKENVATMGSIESDKLTTVTEDFGSVSNNPHTQTEESSTEGTLYSMDQTTRLEEEYETYKVSETKVEDIKDIATTTNYVAVDGLESFSVNDDEESYISKFLHAFEDFDDSFTTTLIQVTTEKVDSVYIEEEIPDDVPLIENQIYYGITTKKTPTVGGVNSSSLSDIWNSIYNGFNKAFYGEQANKTLNDSNSIREDTTNGNIEEIDLFEAATTIIIETPFNKEYIEKVDFFETATSAEESLEKEDIEESVPYIQGKIFGHKANFSIKINAEGVSIYVPSTAYLLEDLETPTLNITWASFRNTLNNSLSFSLTQISKYYIINGAQLSIVRDGELLTWKKNVVVVPAKSENLVKYSCDIEFEDGVEVFVSNIDFLHTNIGDKIVDEEDEDRSSESSEMKDLRIYHIEVAVGSMGLVLIIGLGLFLAISKARALRKKDKLNEHVAV